jgi:hypothetical protein
MVHGQIMGSMGVQWTRQGLTNMWHSPSCPHLPHMNMSPNAACMMSPSIRSVQQVGLQGACRR